MAIPTTKPELITYCRQECGEPVITVNVDDLQVENAIDKALDLFLEFHADGIQRVYLAHEITQDDIDNRYIQLDDNVLAVNRLLPIGKGGLGDSGTEFSGDVMFSPFYSMHFENAFSAGRADMTYYVSSRQYLAQLDDILNAEARFEYSRFDNKLQVHFNWDKELNVGKFVVVEAHIIHTDISSGGKIYSNRIVRGLSAAYTKKRWGENLSKFGGIQLPGGATLDGSTMISEAKDDIEKYETEIRDSMGPEPILYG